MKKLSCFLLSLLLCSALFPSLCFWKTSGGLTWCTGWSCVSARKKQGTIWKENEREHFSLTCWPEAWRKGSRESAALHRPDLHKVCEWRSSICSLTHPSAFVCCLFGWAVLIAIAGALSSCFQRDEIWRSPFVLYIDNNPLVPENYKGP